MEILHGGQRVASHRRSYAPRGTVVTEEHHRPPSHRDYGKWPPERLLGWAAKLGPNVRRVAEMTLAQYPRPEMGFRAVLGLVRVGQRHGAARFDAACARALEVSGSTPPRRKYIEALLARGIERAPAPVTKTLRPSVYTKHPRWRLLRKEKQGARLRFDAGARGGCGLVLRSLDSTR